MDNTVQSTTNYDRFSFLNTNRVIIRGHVEAIKQAFEESGNFTQVQPILVNDRFQIIDGQHRYMAAKETGVPIHYTVVPGLTVSDARKMNALHRSWNVDDYAQSYADSGSEVYRKYLQLREEYGFTHGITLMLVNGTSRTEGLYKRFRHGDFVIENEAAARERLEMLKEITSFLPFKINESFARAFAKITEADEFEYGRMLTKIRLNSGMMRKYNEIDDNLRQLEDIYNYKASSRRVRLF